MRGSIGTKGPEKTTHVRRSRRPQLGLEILALAAVASACTGEIGSPTEGASPSTGAGITAPARSPNGDPVTKLTDTNSTGGGGSSKTTNTTASNGDSTAACSAQTAAPAPLARLTNLEYQNTILALFEGLSLPDLTLPADSVVEGFDNNAKAQTASPALVDAYRANAQAIGALVSANPASVVPCNPTSATQEAACGEQWINSFAPLAYRRPLAADEKSRLLSFFSASRAAYDFKTAVGMLVQGIVQSPQFLYRAEIGEAPSQGRAALSGYELASRLSYFFWDTMPDAKLLNAAANHELDTSAGVAEQARRLLADPRARESIANFHRQWLRFDKMDAMQKSTSLFPNWNAQVAESLRESAKAFVEHVFWDMGGSLDALLTDEGAYINDDIASLYGLQKNGSTTLQWRQTDPARRSGILTQAGLLAGFAHETTDSPVLRGVFVMDRFFCQPPPPPPPGVTGSVSEVANAPSQLTTRDRFAQTHEQGTCATCHHAIDGFGFGFSHYDAVGGWRDTDNGLPVNASGWVAGTDVSGDFDGAVQLGQRMAESTQVRECVTEQWYRYALGLGSEDADPCTVAQIAKALANSSGDMREILVATVSSDAFRHRPEVKP